MAAIRRCRWCHHLIDPRAPVNGHAVKGSYDGHVEHRVQPHCPNAACSWCLRCVQQRTLRVKAGLTPDVDLPPDAAFE